MCGFVSIGDERRQLGKRRIQTHLAPPAAPFDPAVQAVRQRGRAAMRYFDYGPSCRTLLDMPRPCNQAVYGQLTPPAYNLSTIKTPLALFTGACTLTALCLSRPPLHCTGPAHCTPAPADMCHPRLHTLTGGQDRLADPVDSETLLAALPVAAVSHHHHEPDYEHLDFIWGINAAERVYHNVLRLLRHTAVKGRYEWS